MTKYLRCFKSGQYITAGKRYEIIEEVDGLFVFLDDDGDEHCWSIEPDEDGDSYRDHFTLETNDKPIDGRKAEVTHPGRRWTSYHALSARLGYPDAARDVDKDSRTRPREGDVVTILSATDLAGDAVVRDGERVYVVESENGDRHTFSEKGLRILSDNITVLPDESLNGIEREYREVKRKADRGGRIKIVKLEGAFGDYELGDVMSVHARDAGGVRTVEKAGGWGGDGHIYVFDEEYVVLEPTDIVHIADERLRMIDRKATVGGRVIIVSSDKTKSVGCAFRHKVGEAGDVDSRLPDRPLVNGWYILDGDYRVLEPLATAPLLSEQSAQDQTAATIGALALRFDTLTRRIGTLEEAVQRMGTDIRVAQEDIDIMDESIAYDVRKLEAEVAALKEAATTCSRTRPATPAEVIASLKRHRTTQQNIKAARQQRRDDIVERAKADVADLRKFAGTKVPNDPDGISFWPLVALPTDYVPMHTVDYVVNRDKQTVVAIIRCIDDGHTTRGIARCAPNDVFNAHIGKAISLRRALGLEVPAEYLNVPKPMEVRVGDVMRSNSGIYTGVEGTVDEITYEESSPSGVFFKHSRANRRDGRIYKSIRFVEVIDDTREEVAA